jgi:parvulin-like peptidyl-prolyl isomerase/Tfp pilus assembly protein PilF
MSDVLKWFIIGLGIFLLATVVLQKQPGTTQPPAKPKEKAPEITKPVEKMPAEPLAITVNGDAITQNEFESAFAEKLEDQRQLYAQFGQDLDATLVGAEGAYLKLRIKGEAAEELIQKTLYAQASKRLGVTVSEIESEDRFQKEYQRILDFYQQRNGWTEKDIEEKLKEQKSSLAEFKQKIREIVAETMRVEALQAAVAGKIELDDVELLAYLEKETAKYAAEIVKPFHPTDAELTQFWEDHSEDYGRVRVSVKHILIRLDSDAAEESVQAAQAKLAEIQKKLAEGADFSELAKEYSEDPGSKNRGGDVGFVDQTTPFVTEFKEAALELEAGQVSEPVRTRFGFHLIKAEAREAMTLGTLRPQLKEAFGEQKQAELMKDWITRAKAGQTGQELWHVKFILVTDPSEAEKLTELLKSGEEFGTLVHAYSKDGTTMEDDGDLGWFGPGRFGTEFDEVVSKLELGQTSTVFQTPLGFLAVRLEARESEKTLDQVRELITEDFMAIEREQRFKKWYDETRAQSNVILEDQVLAAYFLERENKLDEALTAYETLLRAGTAKDPSLAFYIARLYQSKTAQAQKQRKELEKQSDKAAEIEALDKQIAAFNANALQYLVETLNRTGGDAKLYESILNLDDTNVIAHYKYGLWLFGEGNFDDAITHVKRAIDLDEAYTDALILYADLLRTKKSYGVAAEYYEKALALLPESRELQRKLAESYAGATNWDKAKELYAQLLEKSPQDALLMAALGDVLFNSGDFENAEKILTQAISSDPQISTQLKLAQVYLTSSQWDKAQERFEAVLKASPDEAEALLGLGQTYELKGERDAALKTYLDAYAKPTAVSLRDELGEKILSLEPEKHLEVRFDLARAYQTQHLFEQALGHYQAILDHEPSAEQRLEALLGIADSRTGQAEYVLAKEVLTQVLAVTEDKNVKVEIYEKLIEAERSLVGIGHPLGEEALQALFDLGMLYKELNLPEEAQETLQTLQRENANYRAEEVKTLLAELEKPSSEISNLGPDEKPGQPVEILEAKQVAAGESHADYNSIPPTSGWHQEETAPWGIHSKPIPDEIQVHNLKQGGVLLQYRPDISEEQRKELEELVTQMRKEVEICKVIVAPYPRLDQNFSLTAWGRIDKFDEFDAGRIVQFMLTWIDQGPEKGPCE